MRAQQTSPGAGPVVVLETVKGTIEFETYPEDAPKTVARVLELVKKGFYNGLRFHRAEPNFVIQVGDPTTRDMSRWRYWGGYGTGTPIGVAEITKKRRHLKGAVAMANTGTPKDADSQFYITLRAAPELDGEIRRLRPRDQGPGRCGEDSESGRPQEGFGAGMSGGGSSFTSPFKSG